MRPVVLDAWLAFTEGFEGGVPFPYVDIKNLVTVAYGNLIDPVSLAVDLPFRRPDGTPATKAEIITAWHAVKNAGASQWYYPHQAKLTSLRLTAGGMAALALGKLASNNVELLRRIPDFEELSACVQMAMHSWAWAVGAWGRFPALISAVNARDFEAAAVHIHIKEWTTDAKGARILNKGLIPRNVANKVLMRNAGRVQAFHLDPDAIEWLAELGVSDVSTQPAIDNPASEPTIYPAAPDQPTIHVDPSAYLRPEEWLDRDPDDVA